MQNYDLPPDNEAVERTAYAFPSSGPKLEEAASHSPAVRHAKHRAELHEKFDQPSVVGHNVDRPRLYLVEDLLVEIVEVVGHGTRLANLLTFVNHRA